MGANLVESAQQQQQQHVFQNDCHVLACYLLVGFQTSSTIYKRMFPRTFFDLISHPGGQSQFPEKKNRGSSRSGRLNQSPEMRGVKRGGTEGSGSQSTPGAEGCSDSSVDKERLQVISGKQS